MRNPNFPRPGPASANIYCTGQPEVIKLTTSDVRKLLLTHDRTGMKPVGVEWEIPDAQAFLNEVWACTQWVVHGDPSDLTSAPVQHRSATEGQEVVLALKALCNWIHDEARRKNWREYPAEFVTAENVLYRLERA